MVKNLLLLFGVTIMSVSVVWSQADSCTDSEEIALCDINDIDGTTFTNPDPATADVPPDALCTDGGAFHNPGWFSFVAGSTDITLLVTPLPMTCDTTPGGLTGVQVALWQGCPGEGGMCVAGDADCNDTPVTLEASNLIVGEIYNLTIDGCGGSICTVEVDISDATEFALPDLDDVDLGEPEYNIRGTCDNALGDGNFCAGIPVNFAVDDEFYETLGAEYTWTVSGPDISSIEWEFGPFSGTGPDFIVGDLDGTLGANGINMIFPEPGEYVICLDNAATECDMDAAGEACVTINIVTPGEQEFGVVRVCALDLVAGWEPDFEDENGNPWIAGPITLDQVENATDGILEIETQDDCGCDFTQIIQVIPAGTIEREEVELFIWECMLPYTWFDEEFPDLSSLPIEGDFNIREGSAESDYEGNVCDSLVSLTITPLTIIDTVIIGDCTSNGTEFTFQFIALDPDGNDVTISNPAYEWVDAITGLVVSNTQTALLESGSYFVNFLASLEDLNYMDDELAGIELDAECEQTFGPFDLVGGSSTSPEVNPYQDVFCEANLSLLTFTIDTLVDTDYTWIVPPSYNVMFTAEDSLAVSITDYVPTDTLYVQAANGCGTSDSIPLPITVTDGPPIMTDGLPDVCDGSEYFVGFTGNAATIVSYDWDVPGGSITTGASDSQNIGITYASPGMYDYTLEVTDMQGCMSTEVFTVEVEALLENPTVTCDGDQTEIIFQWEDVPGATSYTVVDISLPGGSVGTLDLANNTYTVTGVSPNDEAVIQVSSEGVTSCVEIASNSNCLASSCDLSGVQIVNFPAIEICEGNPENMMVQFEITLPSDFTGLYTGRGVDPITGLFDPNSSELVIGDNPVVFEFADGAGCSGMFSTVITVNETPIVEPVASSDVFCLGESITISGVPAGAVWDFGADAIGDENGLTYSTPGPRTVMASFMNATTACMDDGMVQIMVNDTIAPPVITCTPGTDNVELGWNDVAGASSYEVSVSINGGTPVVTTQTTPGYTEPVLNEGDVVEITITTVADNGCNTQIVTETCQARTCAVPVIELTASQQIFCSNDILNNPVNLLTTVDGVTPDLGTFTYEGDGVNVSGIDAEFDPNGLAANTYTVLFSYTNPDDGCITTESIDFELIDVPTPSIALDMADICIDEIVTVTIPTQPSGITTQDITFDNGNATLNFINPEEFTLDFDIPGVFDVSLGYQVDNCPDAVVTEQINVTDTVETPRIFCVDVDTDFIEFGWQDQTAVTEYEIYVDGSFVESVNVSGYLISGLNSGDERTIRVVALDPVCGNKESTLMCSAQECVEPTITENVDDVQCYEIGSGPITLDVSAVSNMPNSTVTLSWLESDVNANNEFTPSNTSQDYEFTAVFTEGNCSTQFPVQFRINVVPIADLALNGDMVICEGSSVNVQSNFSGTGNEVANWDFTGGVESGSGFGPYDVTYNTPGTYEIDLVVDNEGCIGEEETITITVEPELEQPQIICNSSDINSVDISWDDVDCGSDYVVFVDGVQATTTTNTSFTIENLTEDQEIEIVVEAISECACGNVMSATVLCASKPCEPTTWTFGNNAMVEYCLDANAQSFTLSATPDDLTGNGTGTWSGTPIADANTGLVDPDLVTAGTYEVVYNYEEAGCSYTSPPLELTFVEEPTLELTAMDPACPMDDMGVITAVGMGGAANYTYSLDGGAAQSSGDFQNVSIGTHTVEVTDDNGCVNMASIAILAPDTPSVEIDGPNTIIIDNDGMFTLDIQNADNIENIIWTIEGNPTPVCEGANCTSYTVISAGSDFVLNVEVIYDGGCMVLAESFPVDVKEIQAFYVPNIVTLNSIDENNAWKIFIKGNETVPKSIKIYDRWGNMVHEEIYNLTPPVSSHILWDGLSDNKALMTGVYVYILEVDVEERTEIIGGDITIFR
ncbi:MAG: hypothetical protein HKN51_15640 [Saprospiraceae bacterium]|nr:hypothetical protein [Saprospiraceae bacterium]